MTTTPVMNITDEQIAEIERDIAAQAKIKHDQCEGCVTVRGEICRECGATPKYWRRRPLPKSYAVPSNIIALISRLRAAEKDAERYRWLRNCDYELDGGAFGVLTCDYDPLKKYEGEELDSAIDAAMEQSK